MLDEQSVIKYGSKFLQLDRNVNLHLYAEDKNHNVYESYDYDFPKCFIKDIEILDE